jgi:hypothetical protein
MEGQIVATSPDHEPTEASPQSPKTPVNGGCIALGGGLGLLAVLSPFIISLLGMWLWAIQAEQETRRVPARTPAASERVCHAVAPAVVARIEAGLKVPGLQLRGVRAVHSAEDSKEWFIAADVQGVGYEGERDTAVWRLTTRGDPSTGAGAPEAAIATKDGLPAGYDALTTENRLAIQVSNFPLDFGDRLELQDAAEACPTPALAGG